MPLRDFIVPSDSSENQVILLWIRLKRSPQTQRVYWQDIAAFQAFVHKPLASVTLEDALNYRDALNEAHITNKRGQVKQLEDNSKRRKINAVKSFYSFAYNSGFFPVNVWRAVRPPTAKSAISARILTESTVYENDCPGGGSAQPCHLAYALCRWPARV